MFSDSESESDRFKQIIPKNLAHVDYGEKSDAQTDIEQSTHKVSCRPFHTFLSCVLIFVLMHVFM